MIGAFDFYLIIIETNKKFAMCFKLTETSYNEILGLVGLHLSF